MKLTALVAVSFMAISSLSADEPPVRWELVKSLAYDEYRDGQLLTFHGHCDEKFPQPDINDFRLERLSPQMTWIPMIFGRDFELDWTASMEMTDVHLYLKCPGATKHIWHGETVMQLFAQTWIEANKH